MAVHEAQHSPTDMQLITIVSSQKICQLDIITYTHSMSVAKLSKEKEIKTCSKFSSYQ